MPNAAVPQDEASLDPDDAIAPDRVFDDLDSRAAANEAYFRDVNDGRLPSAGTVAQSQVHGFLCECSDLGCVDLILLTLGEYGAVRADPRCFVVDPDHVLAEIESVVARTGRYVIVKKSGVAGEIAEQLGQE